MKESYGQRQHPGERDRLEILLRVVADGWVEIRIHGVRGSRANAEGVTVGHGLGDRRRAN